MQLTRFPTDAVRGAILVLAALLVTTSHGFAADESEITFGQHILPILRRNCLACHSASQAEGELVLESVATLQKGGSSGPAIQAGDAQASYLYQVTAALEEPTMPPDDNKVGAKRLTPEELELVQRWINAGAAQGPDLSTDQIAWQVVDPNQVPVMATGISSDGRYLALGRGTQLEVLHVPSQQVIDRPVDPAIATRWQLPPATHVDVIQSLDFSPDGRWLATGGFRTIKLWEKTHDNSLWPAAQPDSAAVRCVANHDASRALTVRQDGTLQLLDLHAGAVVASAHLDNADQPFSLTSAQVQATDSVAGWCIWDSATRQLRLLDHDSLALLAQQSLADDEVTVLAAPPTLDTVSSSDTPETEATQTESTQSQATQSQATQSQATQSQATQSQATQSQATLIAGTAAGQLLRWTFPSVPPDGAPSVTLEPPTRVDAHAGAVNDLVALNVPELPEALRSLAWATAGHDGKIQLWNGQLESQKTLNAPENVVALSAFESAGHLMSGTVGGTLQWWNLTDGAIVHTFAQSDTREKELAASGRKLQLAKLQAENATNDKKTAEERLKQEGTAVEQAQKELEAAAKKIEETKASVVDKQKPLEEKQAALKSAEELVAAATAKRDQLKSDWEAKEAASDEETKAFETMLAAADAAVAEAEKGREEAKKPLEEAQKASNDAIAAAETAVKDHEASQGLLQRNQENHTRAEATMQERETQLKDRNEQVAAAETEQAAQQAAATQERDGIVAITRAGEDRGTLLVLRRDGDLEARNLTDGQLWDTHASTLTTGGLVPLGAQEVVGASKQGSIMRESWLPAWRLAGAIGDPDDANTLTDRVLSLDFSPDSKWLASGGGEASRSGELKIWNVVDRSLFRQWPDAHSDSVFSVRFAPDGRTLASGAADRFAKTFDVETGDPLRVFEGHTHYVQAVGWRADGRLLVTAGADKSVKFWDPLTAEQSKTLNEAKKEVTAVAFLGLENRIVFSAGDGQVVALGSDGGGKQAMAGANSFLHTLDATLDGERVVAAGEDRIVRLWSKDGKLVLESKPVANAAGGGS